MNKEMLVNVLQPEESRIGIVEDGVLEELYVERNSQESYVGNIYKGKVVNIEPSIQAAFVDFGVGSNGFLHVSDVEFQYYKHLQTDRDNGDSERESPPRKGGQRSRRDPERSMRNKPSIQDIFSRGSEVLVQVIKDGIGTKGPTLSTYISIPGRYLVLMPALKRVGVSRKIQDDDERRRLRDAMREVETPDGLGFIVRTAGVDRTKKELQRDMNYLLRLWRVIVRRIGKQSAPIDVYEESDMILRTIRDVYDSEIDSVWIDSEKEFERAREFMKVVLPKQVGRVKHYTGTEPIFQKYGIEDEIARIQSRHVPLEGGGSIVIDQTEALVAIDVNSGTFRVDDNAEETAFQVNMKAAEEISRQLRLRDMGGVIVNDFIDMREERHRRAVERTLRKAVRRDRARIKVLRISPFGLIEMTRQRIRPSLRRSIYEDCPSCSATGQVKTAESVAIEVMRNLATAASEDKVARIAVEVHQRVGNYLSNRKRREIMDLEESAGVLITVNSRYDVNFEHLTLQCFDASEDQMRISGLKSSHS